MDALRLLSMGLLGLLLWFAPAPALAQTDTPDEAVTVTESPGGVTQQELQEAIEEVRAVAAQVRRDAEDAARYADDAGRFLDIFEAISVSITLVIGAVGLFGFLRFIKAENELTRTAREVKADLQQARADLTADLEAAKTRFEHQLREREDALEALKDELRRSAREERSRSDQASLSLSLLPLAERQYKVKDFDGALTTYHRALELDPMNIVIYYRLGYVYTQYGKLDQATFYLSKALDIDETFAPALANMGYVLRRKAERMTVQDISRGEMLADAEKMLRRALHMSPKLVDEDGESWWGSLGGLHQRRGQIDDAIEAYSRALEVTPLSSYPLGNLAVLYMQKRDRVRMIETFERVRQLALRRTQADPTDFWAHADLFLAYLAGGERDGVEDVFNALCDATPTDQPNLLERPLETLRQIGTLMDEANSTYINAYIERAEAFIAQQNGTASSTTFRVPEPEENSS